MRAGSSAAALLRLPAADAGRAPNPGKAADGKRLHRLEADPIPGPIVEPHLRASTWRAEALYAMAEGLTGDGIPSPSAHDPARNRHRDTRRLVEVRRPGDPHGSPLYRPTSVEPTAPGRGPRRRRRRGRGPRDLMRWNNVLDWIWSTEPTHEAPRPLRALRRGPGSDGGPLEPQGGPLRLPPIVAAMS